MKFFFFALFTFLNVLYSYTQNIDSIVTVNRVTDLSHIFSLDETQALENLLIDFEKKTTNQIAIVTINSLNNHTIENAALKIFNNNGLGQKDKDNGVLLLFAKNDRKVRVEVGYGLEPVLTDALSSRIIRQLMIPEFKNENYYAGIEKGINAIIHITGKEFGYETLTESVVKELYSSNTANPLWLKIVITLFLSIFVVAGFFVTKSNPLLKFSTYTKLYTGEISVVHQVINSIQGIFLIPFTIGFIGVPLFFLCIVWEISPFVDYFFNHESNNQSLNDLFGLKNEASIILLILKFLVPALFIFTIAGPLLWVKFIRKKPFKIQWGLSDSEKISMKSSSSGRSYSGSGFSSSSFSSSGSSFGGGGSSGGGGASGSW